MSAPRWEKERENIKRMLKEDESGESVCQYYDINRNYLLVVCKSLSIHVKKKTNGDYNYVSDNTQRPDLPKWLIQKRHQVMVSMPFGALCK